MVTHATEPTRPSVPTVPTVVVVGAGPAGALSALHLLRAARRRAGGVEVLLVDPADRWGRGVAFGTAEDEHLLNVPAGAMSALPEDPGHFVAWLREHVRGDDAHEAAFVGRRTWGAYLDDTLRRTAAADVDGRTSVRHVRARVTGLREDEGGWVVHTETGDLAADAVVVAAGLPGSEPTWAPEALAGSPFFVPDPWRPGALDVVRRDRTGPADVLVVGSGLTGVDVVLTLTGAGNRPDRRVHVVSRNGLLPRVHREPATVPLVPEVEGWGPDLADVLVRARAHVEEVRTRTGDWRAGIDGLRHRVGELWSALPEADRALFRARHAADWNRLRHRMPRRSAELLDALQQSGRLTLCPGEVADARPLEGGGLAVTLRDGTVREVGWVVACTGPVDDVRRADDALLADLVRERPGGALTRVDALGLGLHTDGGRLGSAPVWVVGALRRADLWESTAVPEIRQQARAAAEAVLHEVAPLPRRLEDGRWVGGHHPVARPRDPLGLPLSTTAEAAAVYGQALERVLRLQDGAEVLLRQAARLDPDFALAPAALALLGHEGGVDVDVTSALAAARSALGRRGDDRERSFVDVVGRRVAGGPDGRTALLAHLATHPRDALAVSAAVPTIAFSGVTDVQREAWDLVEGLAPAYGDHWWYHSLLAFVRQDQGRLDEAALLAESALACEPSSGHAVHALTHVFYESGQHEAGLAWLDQWISSGGRSATHLAHFCWHAALHELTLGDTEAVRRRYYSQLVPPTVTGVRALVDSASLLWRWALTTSDWPGSGESAPPPVGDVLDGVDPALLTRPGTPFGALHAAVALTAAGQADRLDRLRRRCLDSTDPVERSVVAPVAAALGSMVEGDWDTAARGLAELLPVLPRVGGSAAQREVLEEALLLAWVKADRADKALALLDVRLDRRPSPLDLRRATSLRVSVPR